VRVPWRCIDRIKAKVSLRALPSTINDRFFKLHHASPGELDGPGHDMNDGEFFTECVHYDDTTLTDLKDNMAELGLLDIETAQPVSEADVESYERHSNVGFLDFSNAPEDFQDSQNDEFDEKFPKHIRAGDSVKVVASGKVFCPCSNPDCKIALFRDMMPPFKERFWVNVISVTSFEMITGTTGAELNGSQLNKFDLLAFPQAAVLGLKKGENWP